MTKPHLVFFLTAIAVVQSIDSSVLAAVDQSSTAFGPAKDVKFFGPFGQSFVPTLPSLDFVELNLTDNTSKANGVTAAVRIRGGDINGPTLGTSQPVFLADCFNFSAGAGCGMAGGSPVEIHFDFTASVALVPSQTYVLEPFAISGDTFAVLTAATNPYAPGTAIFNGSSDSTSDLWLKEGTVPEPSTIMLLVFGSTACLAAAHLRG